jgi:uncharacterized protein YxjI
MGDLVPTTPGIVTTFGKSQRLSVRQRKRWLEILTSFDARNVYLVYDEAGQPVLNVEEQGSGFGAFMKRLFLAWARPFTSHVEDLASGGTHLLTLRRPFRFIFHRLEVSDAQGNRIGAIQRKWTWFRRKYIVEGPDGQPVATLFGPFFRPWTFQVLLPDGKQIGLIQKKWSGLLKEMFTEADNFWVAFDAVEDPAMRALLFSATVLIDVVHFERKN